MSRVDLTSVEWCELIFQDRNRSYGAYKMRSESRKRHTWAMVAVVGIALVVSCIPTLMKFASPNKMEEKIVEVAVLSQLEEPEVKQEEFKRVDPVAPPPALKSSIKFTAPVIKKDEEVTEEDEIKSQAELTESKVNISIADVKGNDELNGKDIAELKEVIVKEDESEKPYTMVEQMPQFPGGEGALLAHIAKSLQYPALSAERGVQGKVILRFVVTAKGTVEGVEVLRSLDPHCDKEAIRVIAGLPQWIPGRQNGHNVPVYYTVPITFKLQ